MLLILPSKEKISLAKDRLISLGLEHQLLPTAQPTFEIQAELSIYPPKVLKAKLMDLGEVQHGSSKTPFLDDVDANHSVVVELRRGKKIIFQNGTNRPVWISGPCSIDTEENLRFLAVNLSSLGVHFLRGGALKPRTSPHDFQGIGRNGYKILAEIAHEYQMGAISEALSEYDVEEAAEYLDILQVGARNMKNFSLLKKLGKLRKPILLKRAPGASLREWASAAEYILAEGNKNIILCERGVRGLERELRYTLDFAGAAFMQQRYGLPVLIDPSHATGTKQILAQCTAATISMGFCGIMLEAHPRPSEARSDSLQALSIEEFSAISKQYLR